MEEKETENIPVEPIPIDYDAPDVADIMARIKERIARNPRVPEEEPAPAPERGEDGIPDRPEPPEPPDLEVRSRAKRILLKLMKPFTPVVKLLVLPVNEELVRTVKIIDHMSKWQNYTSAVINRDLRLVIRDFNRRADELDGRLRALETEFATSKEHTKLLHNLSHNLVVELTKLRIEHESLKSRARIMEKDFETVVKREKSLERKLQG